MDKIRKDFKKTLEDKNLESLKSYLNFDLSASEIKTLKDQIDGTLFFFVVEKLIQKDLLTKVFSEKEIMEYLSKFSTFIVYAPNKCISNLIEVYPKVLYPIVKTKGIYYILKTFEYDDNILKIINVIGKMFGYYKVLKTLFNYKNDIDQSTYLITNICKHIANNPSKINEKILFELKQMSDISLSKSRLKKFFSFIKKVKPGYNFYEILTFYNHHICVCDFILGNHICEENSKLENLIVSACKKNFGLLVEILPTERLNGNLKEVILNAKEVLKESDKINTAAKNPNFTYELIKYVYPILGKKLTLDLLKYNSPGYRKICDLCLNQNYSELKKSLDLYEKLNLFPDESESIHYIFNNFSDWYNLRNEIIKHNYNLDEKSKKILKLIIKKGNILNINTLDDLINIEERLYNYLGSADNRFFGYLSLNKLIDDYSAYKLNNIVSLKKIYQEANFRKDLLLTKEEFEIIDLLRTKLKAGIYAFEIKMTQRYANEKTLFLAEELENIFTKLKKTYAVAFNNRLTKIADLKTELRKDYDGVEVLYIQKEKFNFLIHTLKGLDYTFFEYPDLLKRNPDYWDKLEGSTTISLCSISNLQLNYVGASTSPKKTVKDLCYLFTDIKEDSLLYMGCEDVHVAEGGHQLNSEARNLDFYDIDALNHYTGKNSSNYNEIVLKRDGLIPRAIASFDQEPSFEEIKAAKYFNVPIINFSMCNNVSKNRETYNCKRKIMRKPSVKNIYEIIYKAKDKDKIFRWCLNVIQSQKNLKVLSNEEYTKILFLLKRESNILQMEDVSDYLKELIYINSIADKYIDKYFLELDDNLNNIFIIINNQKYFARYAFNEIQRSRVLKNKVINNFRELLGINALQEFYFLDDKTKYVSLESYYSIEELELFTYEKLYDEQYDISTLLQEYLLNNFFNNTWECTTPASFFLDKNGKIYPNDLAYNPSYILDINLRIFDDKLYDNEDIFKYVSVKLNSGELNGHLNTLLDLANKIEWIDDQKFIDVFKEYFLYYIKESKTNYKYEDYINSLLEQKRVFPNKVRRKVEQILHNTAYSKSRMKK